MAKTLSLECGHRHEHGHLRGFTQSLRKKRYLRQVAQNREHDWQKAEVFCCSTTHEERGLGHDNPELDILQCTMQGAEKKKKEKGEGERKVERDRGEQVGRWE